MTPALAAKEATATIPIAFIAGADPIDSGLVTSISRPTSNVTGINIFADVLTPKRQELLHELVPTASFVAMLVNPTAAQTQSELRAVQPAADGLDQQVRILGASTDRELDAAFATFDQRIGGLLVQPDPFFTSRRDQLVLLTTRHAIPTVFAFREFVTAGGLMSYGTSLRAAYRQLGVYAARILKGEKPADLPVQQATAFETVVNLKAAKALGVTIPTAILLRADEVIE
jgi:putative ABC transport system substrate-binding protein